MAQQNDNDDTSKKNQNQTNKNRKKGNFITEWMRTFSASSPNTSGSYNLLINYDELPFPGPEIGKWALEKSPLTAVTTTSPTDPANGDRYGSLMPATSPTMPHLHMMTVAGGCFWGVQLLLDRVPGVEYTLVGYTQGRPTEIRPNYDQVSVAGATSHTEAVLVYYDPAIVSYETLIKDVFLKHIDPTTVNGQGRDYGKQYRTGIYTHTLEQEQTARRIVMEDVAPKLDRPIATELRPATIFWPAEPYHQKYLQSGGRFGIPQSAEKGSNETIRCYG
jgi:peptide-methionine (S)-S-oxide reductase